MIFKPQDTKAGVRAKGGKEKRGKINGGRKRVSEPDLSIWAIYGGYDTHMSLFNAFLASCVGAFQS